MLDLDRRSRDVRLYVDALQTWGIAALGRLGVKAFPSSLGTGIWVDGPDGERKIGAIGVRVRRWKTFHGMAINVTPDLRHFDAIVPCGISDSGVARLVDLAPGVRMSDLDEALRLALPNLLHSLSGRTGNLTKTLEADGDCR
jgi:lipoyl(octanoyl) transferase